MSKENLNRPEFPAAAVGKFVCLLGKPPAEKIQKRPAIFGGSFPIKLKNT